MKYRLRPVATPAGFRFHVDCRPESSKYARVWQQLSETPLTKAEANEMVNTAREVE